MGDNKNLIMGLALASFVAVIFVGFLADSSPKYDSNYNTSTLLKYNKTNDLNNIAINIQNEANKTSSSSIIDVFLAYFKLGYNGFKYTIASVGIGSDVINTGVSGASLGESADAFKTFLILILILFVIGVWLYILLGREW